MNNISYAIIEGRLVRDPETKTMASGRMLTKFSVAVNSEWGKSEDEKAVSYIDVEAWGRSAETCAEYLSQGRSVTVQGALRQDRWQDEDGKTRSRIKIVARDVRFNPAFAKFEEKEEDVAEAAA